MDLFTKARQEAKKEGKKLDKEIVEGLKAVQKMHDLCKEVRGSPYRMYLKMKT